MCGGANWADKHPPNSGTLYTPCPVNCAAVFVGFMTSSMMRLVRAVFVWVCAARPCVIITRTG